MCPRSNTRISSAATTVDKRCAITSVVRPRASRASLHPPSCAAGWAGSGGLPPLPAARRGGGHRLGGLCWRPGHRVSAGTRACVRGVGAAQPLLPPHQPAHAQTPTYTSSHPSWCAALPASRTWGRASPRWPSRATRPPWSLAASTSTFDTPCESLKRHPAGGVGRAGARAQVGGADLPTHPSPPTQTHPPTHPRVPPPPFQVWRPHRRVLWPVLCAGRPPTPPLCRPGVLGARPKGVFAGSGRAGCARGAAG